MGSLVSIIQKTILVLEEERGVFTVAVYVDGRLNASYGSGSRAWADKLAAALASNDDWEPLAASAARR
jgi:hypothetical protein